MRHKNKRDYLTYIKQPLVLWRKQVISEIISLVYLS